MVDPSVPMTPPRHRPVAHRLLHAVACFSVILMTGCGGPPRRDPDVLTVILPRDAEQLDPRFVGDPYGLKVSRLLFASLVTIDPDTLAPVPDLAESITPESDTRYRVRLRRGLRFSDGSPLTAADVRATFEGVVDEALGSRYAQSYRRIAHIETPDPRTVVFTLDAAHATFITDLELPVMRAADARRQVAQLGGPAPIGAGPYVLSRRGRGDMRLSANPHWHGGRPRHPEVRFLVIRDDNTRAMRLRAGAGDLAQVAVPPLLLPLFDDDPQFVIRTAPGIGTTYLGFHTEAQPLDDVRVRRAIALAIDREALIEAELGGRATLAESWIPVGHWAATPIPQRPRDLAEARRLLDAAQLPDPPGPRPRARLTLRVSTDRARVSIARAIAAMLREVGLEVEVRSSETATLIADLNRGQFQMTFLQVPEVIEPHVLSWFFASDRIPGAGRSGANRWRIRSPALDEALERGRRHHERAIRVDAYRTAQHILAEQLPVVPLWQEHVTVVARTGVHYPVPRDGRFSHLAR